VVPGDEVAQEPAGIPGVEDGSSAAASGCARPPVAIVTVNYNGGRFIGEFLRSVAALEYPAVRLVVVDCASRDGSPDLIARLAPQAVLIRCADNRGFTGGSNLGITWALARGFPYVLFLNNDTVFPSDLVNALMARAGPRTLVAPRVLLRGTAGLMDDTVGEFDLRRGVWRHWVFGRPCPPELSREREVTMASLCCLLAPAAVFRHVGLLDERLFMYYEDFDFILRARSAGYRIWYVPAATVYHRKSASSGGGATPFKLYYATRNRAALMRRHASRVEFLRFSLDFAVTRLLRAAQYAGTGRGDLAAAMLRGWLDAYRGHMGRTFPPPACPSP
jgi:GT2 family glycosyltransferase